MMVMWEECGCSVYVGDVGASVWAEMILLNECWWWMLVMKW